MNTSHLLPLTLTTVVGVTTLISQLLYSFGRKQAQSPNTVTQLQLQAETEWELRRILDSKIHCQWINLCGNPWWAHHRTAPSATCLPFHVLTPCTKSCTLDCINRFLKRGIFWSFLCALWCLAYAYPLWNHLHHQEREHYLSSPKVSFCLFEINSSWLLPTNPLLQATTRLLSVTID